MENEKIYAQDSAFWQKYIKGRPYIPDKFFDRLAQYHASHGGEFNTVHDIGAGPGVQSHRLKKYFKHVIISDIVAENVQLAEQRLGTDGYSYHTSKIEDSSCVPEGSVDMVFAAFAMHHSRYEEAFPAIARQLKSGGTFCAFISSIAWFELKDKDVEAVYERIWAEGNRVLLRHAKDRNARLRTLGHAAGKRDTMPLEDSFWKDGAVRLAINAKEKGVWPAFIPVDVQEEFDGVFGGESAVGSNDVVVFEEEDGWEFDADLQFLRDYFDTTPFAVLEPSAFKSMFEELEVLFRDGRKVKGVYPARVILATRK